MTAYAFLVRYWREDCGGVLPMSTERPCTVPSNSEVRRWLDKGAVILNGTTPKPNDAITFPITDLVFFPHARRRTTYA